MKYTRSLFALAMLLGLTVAVAESTHAQMNLSAPSAGGVPKSASGNMTTANKN